MVQISWTAPITWTANQTVTAAQMNSQIRSNMLETAVAKATTAGSHFAASGTNSVVQRTSDGDLVSTSQTSTSTSYTDLATVGPSVTATCSGTAFVTLYAQMSNSGSTEVYMGYVVSGANTIAESDSHAIMHASSQRFGIGATFIRLSMASGSSTFKGRYKVAGSTGTWEYRRIVVLPF